MIFFILICKSPLHNRDSNTSSFVCDIFSQFFICLASGDNFSFLVHKFYILSGSG